MNATKFAEARPRSLWKPLRNRIEVFIEGEEHRIFARGVSSDKGIGAVHGKFFRQPDDLVAARLKELADGFRHAVVSKELNRLEMAAQAASKCVRRTARTSLTVRDGYSATIPSSE